MQWALLVGGDYNAISTSRPGIDNATSAIPTGLYQFELGTNMMTSPGMDTTITVPILIRLGVMENTDLQIGYTGSSLTLGVLYGGIHIISGLENSIMLTTSLPVPMNGISYEDNNDSLIEYSAYLPISYSFQNGLSVVSQIAGTFYNNEEINPIISYSLAIGNSLNKKTGWFFEAYQSQTIKNDSTILERKPLENAAKKRQLGAFKHEGFWQCMDTKKDKDKLNEIFSKKKIKF